MKRFSGSLGDSSFAERRPDDRFRCYGLQRIVDLKELGVDEANYGLCWSTDGRKLAFASYNRATGNPGPGPIFVVSAEGGEITRLATDDSGQKDYLYWSPDGKWISYNCDTMVKTSPEGAIWEADVSEFLSGGKEEK
jgi:dipeptidyl aminopeptidase/acylaminoacyl peptidase